MNVRIYNLKLEAKKVSSNFQKKEFEIVSLFLEITRCYDCGLLGRVKYHRDD